MVLEDLKDGMSTWETNKMIFSEKTEGIEKALNTKTRDSMPELNSRWDTVGKLGSGSEQTTQNADWAENKGWTRMLREREERRGKASVHPVGGNRENGEAVSRERVAESSCNRWTVRLTADFSTRIKTKHGRPKIIVRRPRQASSQCTIVYLAKTSFKNEK